MEKTPLAFLLLAPLFLLLSGCAGELPPPSNVLGIAALPPTELGINATEPKLAILHATVFDNATGVPIEGAVVFLGYHSSEERRCRTSAEGKCTLQSEYLSWGDYGLHSFRKGYFLASQPANFAEGNNSITIGLQGKGALPGQVSVSGTLVEQVYAPGTRSEDHLFKIKTETGEEYLFNEAGENYGFDAFVNKQVEITGFREEGFVGWAHRNESGIYVENIVAK